MSYARIFTTAWLPFIFIPLSAVSYIGVPPKQNPEASALINLMRNLGGSVGVSLTTAELAWRGQEHWERLGESVTPYNLNQAHTSFGQIASAVQQQSQMLAYIDIFVMLAFVALALAPLAILLPRSKPGAAAGH